MRRRGSSRRAFSCGREIARVVSSGCIATEAAARSPITGELLGHVAETTDVGAAIGRAATAFTAWRERAGAAARRAGAAVRRRAARAKDELARLVTLEAGKIAARASARSRR
jgi:aldehyde dehydrogenase (NAD+)